MNVKGSMGQKKEIIIFTEGMGNCGIQRVLSELTNSWAEKGYKISIVYIVKNDEKEDDFSWNPSIELVGIAVPGTFFSDYYKLVRSYIRILKDRPNAVAVSLSVMTNFAIGAAAPFVKNRIVISDRNDPTQRPSGKMKQFFRNLAFRQADVLILQTEDVKQYYEKTIHRSGFVIPNPINDEISLIPVAEKRRPVVVTASRLNKQKNLGMLIDAFSLFSKEHPEYTLEIYGRGSEEDRLRNKANASPAADRIVFKGFSKNLYRDIVDSGIYVCSSDYEGISNALLEALGLGIPTISTDCPVGGSRLLIKNDENGILIRVGDTQELYRQMKRIAESPELSRKLSGNAIRVREEYRIDCISQLWLDRMFAE